MAGVLITRKIWAPKCTEKSHVKTQGQDGRVTGVTQPQAKEQQGLLVATGSGSGMKGPP